VSAIKVETCSPLRSLPRRPSRCSAPTVFFLAAIRDPSTANYSQRSKKWRPSRGWQSPLSTGKFIERSKRRGASFQAALSSAVLQGCIDRLVGAASGNLSFQSSRVRLVDRQTPLPKEYCRRSSRAPTPHRQYFRSVVLVLWRLKRCPQTKKAASLPVCHTAWPPKDDSERHLGVFSCPDRFVDQTQAEHPRKSIA
jgi:hypothetical protein